MLVGRSQFEDVLSKLKTHNTLALDTETFGLRPYHGDRLFSLILAPSEKEAFYFNFNDTPEFEEEFVLDRSHLARIDAELFSDGSRNWYIHKFNFDLHILGVEGLEIAGTVHCTLNNGRVEYNDHMSYDLDASLERIGLKKDGGPEEWIKANHAWEWMVIPGKKQRKKNKFYSKVPRSIIVPYGEDDAKGGFALGEHQIRSIASQSSEYPSGVPRLQDTLDCERRLAKTIYRMERVGVKIDRGYCVRAARFEADRAEKARANFARDVGRDFSDSPKLFAAIFADERDKWGYTDKGNPSFESDTLKYFKNPAAKTILEHRDAKSKVDFYTGFLYHADGDDRIHPSFNPGRTRSGRLSSSDPNLQNLTNEEDEAELAQEFVVRRAFIPTPGYVFFMPDYRAVEYRMMLDYASLLSFHALRSVHDCNHQNSDQNSRLGAHLGWKKVHFPESSTCLQGTELHNSGRVRGRNEAGYECD